MTGITLDELIQMAREAGIALNEPTDGYCMAVGIPVGSITTTGGHVFLKNLQSLLNAILERAAEKADNFDCPDGFSGSWIGDEIRALKINTGD